MAELWYPLTITQSDIAGGFQIVLTTDRPCHLWLYWTMNPPWTHRITRLERGLSVPWDAYWCYTSWSLIEQDEPGDTTTHTFQWPGWFHCQTKYFRFHGDIGGVASPSDSPIFNKHYTEPAIGLISYSYCGRSYWFIIYRYLWCAYGFEALRSGTLSHINVDACKTSTTIGNLTIDVFNADSNYKPTGGPIGTIIVDKSFFPNYPDFSSLDLPLPAVSVTEGQNYAIRFGGVYATPYAYYRIMRNPTCEDASPQTSWTYVPASETYDQHGELRLGHELYG